MILEWCNKQRTPVTQMRQAATKDVFNMCDKVCVTVSSYLLEKGCVFGVCVFVHSIHIIYIYICKLICGMVHNSRIFIQKYQLEFVITMIWMCRNHFRSHCVYMCVCERERKRERKRERERERLEYVIAEMQNRK